MNIISSSENESSSQYHQKEQQPGLKNLISALDSEIDPEVGSKISKHVAKHIKHARNQKFDQCITIIVKLLGKGYGKELAKQSVILQVMMDRYGQLCQQVGNGLNSQMKIMYLLSAIAELIKEASKVQFTLKKRFLQSLFLIDQESLGVSPIKRDILAVLGVIYEYLSRDIKAMKKFELIKQFKQVILTNYSLIDQQFSSRLFNKALYNLALQGEPITEAQLAKYGVFQTLIRVMGSQQAGILISKLKSGLQKLNAKKTCKPRDQRTQMVAESS